jgi:2-oxo-3-hexenedioate decarboxylase
MRLKEGAVHIGRKIGFTNPEMWSIYGVSEPIWGYMYDTTVLQLSDPQVRCRMGQFVEPKIEPEIVLHFRSAPPANASPEQILGAIDWVAHGIEIVQSHFPGWKFELADTIANWSLHARLLVGEPRDIKHLGPEVISDIKRFTLALSCDGELREQGQGSNALGSPLLAVAHLIDVLAQQPQALPLQAGELVTTGTLTPALPIEVGQRWSTALEGIALPGITVSFEL